MNSGDFLGSCGIKSDLWPWFLANLCSRSFVSYMYLIRQCVNHFRRLIHANEPLLRRS
uniref:Rhomboid-like protein n=1 Tax=Rhizophora mucronata TaxID=61149 RepID=A0A2P2KTL9_RHIMU